MIVVIDYGIGNVGSIINMLRKLSIPARVSNNTDIIEKAEKIILPGVGSFDNGIERLRSLELEKPLKEMVINRHKPLLGICLGMQLLFNTSEEGRLPGLGWLSGTVRRFVFQPGSKLKIPHMGWNTIQVKKTSLLSKGLETNARFYFVHSFYVSCDEPQDCLMITPYGGEFVSAVEKGNIFGVQFHPEKSHRFGLQILKNFSEIPSC